MLNSFYHMIIYLFLQKYANFHAKILIFRVATDCMLGGQPNHGGNFAFLFNCTPVGRTSDSMMVRT